MPECVNVGAHVCGCLSGCRICACVYLWSPVSVCEAVSGYVLAHGDVLCGSVFVSVSVCLTSGFLI